MDALFRDALIHVTSFFRDPAVFQTLQERVLPQIIKRKPLGEPIRFWVPGCSTGEEVYSLGDLPFGSPAFGRRTTPDSNLRDRHQRSGHRTRAGGGVSEIDQLARYHATRLHRFFSACTGGYQVTKALREACIFARQDVASDPPFARIDLISCRNLLIYFDAALQKKVLPTLHYALNPGGYLVLGQSEGSNSFDDLFERGGLETKDLCEEAHAAARLRSLSGQCALTAPEHRGDAAAPLPANPPDVRKSGDRVLLRRLSPCGVTIDSEFARAGISRPDKPLS